MTIDLTAPGALWLLAAVPVVWLLVPFARTNFNRRQQRLQAAVRSLLLVVLALALARPVVSTSSARMSVVYLVDVSHSVSGAAVAQAATRIDELDAALRPAHSRVVAFGLDAVVLDGTAALRALAAADPGDPGARVQRGGSDLERALTLGRAELLPGHMPRVVLFSDGRETAGDAAAAALRFAAERVPVFVEALAVRDLGDSWIERVRLPGRLAPGALVTAAVDVGSQREAAGVLEIREGSRVLARQPVALPVGEAVVRLDLTFDRSGPHVIEAVLAVAGDPLEINNRLRREAFVHPPSRVLYVEGATASARYLEQALVHSGLDVQVAAPSALPRSRAALEPWDVVILSDVARVAVPDESMAALAEWVEQSGGGLLLAGGESVFGEGDDTGPGGYRHTELERLLPVTFERKDEPEVALIIVLDRSWSMAGQVMELCKSAAQAAIDVLTDEQSVGVITFNDGLNWDVTLRNVGAHRAEIQKAIAAIQPAGHTLIFPAIEQAYVALRDARARAKHVVLLSDGRSYPDDYEGLVRRMVEAKMTVSSIAVGPAADVELLTNIAKWGRGRSYVVEDAREVPQIFVKEAKDAATPGFDEKAIRPVLKARGFLEGVDFARVPNLRGRTAVVLKDTAFELVATEDGDPLLAFWPAGLGRTAVFASDVKDRWASDWLRWRGYAPFFAAVVHAIERERRPPLGLEVMPGVIRGGTRPVTVVVEARDENGHYRDLLRPVVRVRSADDRTADVVAQQQAPGRYEAVIMADAAQALTIGLAGAETPVEPRVVLPDPDQEYRLAAPDLEGLDRLAGLTGGARAVSADALARTQTGSQTARRALWPWLVVLALGIWLADVLLRRVRLFEPA